MTNKEIVFEMLKKMSLKMDGSKDYGITAQSIADELDIRRNVVSHLLNELNKEELAIKINTRPVYFVAKEVYETRKSSLKLVGKYIRENEKADRDEDGDIFKNLIGYDGSLKYVVDQCKSAVLYPPNGLPFLLVGNSGVGKSFLAQMVYDYAKAIGTIKSNSPFIIFNCAEYANNPELLSATLFGSCKGSYTGADADRIGLIEDADGGFLFLDEIHRLPPEGQEKLFLFLDKGIFRRLGESGKKRSANVRLIFATTENPENSFLQTFLRRIPLIVRIPTFRERPLKEKLELIYNIYKNEAININKDILVSSQVVNILLKSRSNGNIGKLFNTIRLSCANAFNNYNDKKSQMLNIKINNLPKEFLDECDGTVLSRDNFDDMLLSCSNNKNEAAIFDKGEDKLSGQLNEMLDLVKKLQSEEITYDSFFNSSLVVLNNIIDKVVFNEDNKKTKDVLFNFIQKIVEDVVFTTRTNKEIKYYSNSEQIFTCLLSNFIGSYYTDYDEEVDGLIEFLKRPYSKEFKIASKIIDGVEKNLDININKTVMIVMLIYIRSLNKESNPEQINAVIIAHGNSTASSISNAANRMLGEYVFEAIDMPLELSVLEVCSKLNSYIKTIDAAKGLIILVDMGSLESISKNIDKEFYGDISIINNVSTQLALDVGRSILNAQPLEQITKEVIERNSFRYTYIPYDKKKEDAIITTCITGIGTAKKIKDLLTRCFSDDEIKVMAYDYGKLKGNGRDDYIFKKYNVKLIIGTNDPNIEEIPYISLEDLIMRKGDTVLINTLSNLLVNKKIIDRINSEIIKLFTLENVLNYLTILNPDKIIDQVEQAMYTLEMELGFKFGSDLKISLCIHICCMIERLVIKDPIMTYVKIQEFEQCHLHFVQLVKKAFSVIEQFYKVEIPVSEIGFIYDSIKKKSERFEL